MDRKLFNDFNKAYGSEPTKEEQQLIEDMLQLWGKLETSAAKNPALIRKGIVLGLALGKAIERREIIPRPARAKRKAQEPGETAEKRYS